MGVGPGRTRVAAAGGVVAEPERLGDDGCGCLPDELVERGEAGCGAGDAEFADARVQGVHVERLAGAAAGKQPAGGGVGGGLRVLPLACCSQQQAGEGLGHWGGWLSEPSLYCPVIVFGDVVDAQPDDAAGRLGVEQHQTAGHAGAQRWFVVGEDPTQQRQAPALGDVLACVGLA